MKPKEIVQILAGLKALYPRQPIGVETLAVYSKMLVDLDEGELRRAVTTHAATSRFFPSVAELRELATAGDLDRLSAMDAWGEVVAAIRQFGMYRQPRFPDPRIESAVCACGWQALCQSSVTDASIRARFCEAFDAAHGRAKLDANIGTLSGAKVRALSPAPEVKALAERFGGSTRDAD